MPSSQAITATCTLHSAADEGTQVAVSMTSDQGGGYLATTSRAHQRYRAR